MVSKRKTRDRVGYADRMSYLSEALQEPDEHENGPIERHHQRRRDQREEDGQCHADRQQHLIVIPTADHRGRQVHYQVAPEERAQDQTLRVLRPIEYLTNVKTFTYKSSECIKQKGKKNRFTATLSG